ncbi:unnamed protein product [Caenorhabditis brenneri]
MERTMVIVIANQLAANAPSDGHADSLFGRDQARAQVRMVSLTFGATRLCFLQRPSVPDFFGRRFSFSLQVVRDCLNVSLNLFLLAWGRLAAELPKSVAAEWFPLRGACLPPIFRVTSMSIRA